MKKRIVIVDFNHMAHTLWNSQFAGGFSPSVQVVENGEVIQKNTAIQNGAIKNIHRWSNGGSFPTAVCFDRPVPARKAYFQASFEDMKVGTAGEYKGGREKMPPDMYEGIQDCERILRASGVSCFSEQGYEADDLIFACVKYAKQAYPGYPIDVITNDADLLPLVDDVVSVFLRSKRGTYAIEKSLEKAHYIQVTPNNFQETVEALSDYKGFIMPYNSLLLHKLLRGDKSDNYKRKDISRLFSPTKWNPLIEQMLADGVDFSSMFRYGESTYKILYRDTDKEFEGTLKDALNSPDKANLYQKIGNPVELDNILSLLREYTILDDDMLSHIEKMYWGINLNQTFPNKDKRLARRGYVLDGKAKGSIEPFSEIKLQQLLLPLRIKLRGLN